MQRSRSTSTSFMKSGCSGPGTISMQSTGQNADAGLASRAAGLVDHRRLLRWLGRGGLSTSIFLRRKTASAMSRVLLRRRRRCYQIDSAGLRLLATPQLDGTMRRMIGRPDRAFRPRRARTRSFDELALEAFCSPVRAQSRPPEALRAGRALRPRRWPTGAQVPAVPTLAFKIARRSRIAEPREVFRSRGTTDATPSVHHHPIPTSTARSSTLRSRAPVWDRSTGPTDARRSSRPASTLPTRAWRS